MGRVYGFLDQVMAGDGRLVTAEGVTVPAEAVSARDEIVLFVPGTDVHVLSAAIPVRSEAEARAAAPFIVEDEIAVPVEDVHIALGPAGADLQAARVLHVVARSKMERWQDWLVGAPDFASAKLVAEQSVLAAEAVCHVDGAYIGHVGERVFALDAALPEAVVEAYIDGRSPVPLLREAFLAVLARGADGDDALVDLRQGAFRVRSSLDMSGLGPWRLSGALAAVLVLVWFATMLLETASLRADAERVEASIASAYAAALPDAPRPSNYVQAVSRAVNAGGGGGGISFREASAALYAALLDVPEAQLLMMRYDRAAGELVATVSYSAYGDDVALKAALLVGREFDVNLGDARQENAGVVGDIIIRRGRL